MSNAPAAPARTSARVFDYTVTVYARRTGATLRTLTGLSQPEAMAIVDTTSSATTGVSIFRDLPTGTRPTFA